MSTSDWVTLAIFFSPVALWLAFCIATGIGAMFYAIAKGFEAAAYSLIRLRAEWRKAGSS